MEQHGHPPLLLDLESVDGLDHVLFLFNTRGLWGTIAKSRDVGLHGRKPVFRTLRHLALSYVIPMLMDQDGSPGTGSRTSGIRPVPIGDFQNETCWPSNSS